MWEHGKIFHVCQQKIYLFHVCQQQSIWWEEMDDKMNNISNLLIFGIIIFIHIYWFDILLESLHCRICYPTVSFVEDLTQVQARPLYSSCMRTSILFFWPCSNGNSRSTAFFSKHKGLTRNTVMLTVQRTDLKLNRNWTYWIFYILSYCSVLFMKSMCICCATICGFSVRKITSK